MNNNPNWLIFDSELEKGWNDHTSVWLSNVLGKIISVRLRLPSEEVSRVRWQNG